MAIHEWRVGVGEKTFQLSPPSNIPLPDGTVAEVFFVAERSTALEEDIPLAQLMSAIARSRNHERIYQIIEDKPGEVSDIDASGRNRENLAREITPYGLDPDVSKAVVEHIPLHGRVSIVHLWHRGQVVGVMTRPTDPNSNPQFYFAKGT